MFFHRSYVFLFGEIPGTNSDEINDLAVKPETPFKNTNPPSTPCPTSQRERKPVHDTPSICHDKQVVCLPLMHLLTEKQCLSLQNLAEGYIHAFKDAVCQLSTSVHKSGSNTLQPDCLY